MGSPYNESEFAGHRSQWVSPDAYPITPNDNENLPTPVRALRVAGAGNVKVVTVAGNTRTLAFLAGETRYIACTKVFAADTDATGIEGMT